MEVDRKRYPIMLHTFKRIKLGKDDAKSPTYPVEFSRREMQAIEGLRDVFYSDEIKDLAFSRHSVYAQRLWYALPAEEGLMHRENSLRIIKQLYDLNRHFLTIPLDEHDANHPYERQLAAVINEVLGTAFPEIVPLEEAAQLG